MTWRELIFNFVGLCTVAASVAIISIVMLRVSGYTVVTTATRVAHDETKIELADTLTELAVTLIELHTCENKQSI